MTSLRSSNQFPPSNSQQPEFLIPDIKSKTDLRRSKVNFRSPLSHQSINKSNAVVRTRLKAVVKDQSRQISETTQNSPEQAKAKRLEAERLEAEQLAAAQAEAQRIAAQKAEEQRLWHCKRNKNALPLNKQKPNA